MGPSQGLLPAPFTEQQTETWGKASYPEGPTKCLRLAELCAGLHDPEETTCLKPPATDTCDMGETQHS